MSDQHIRHISAGGDINQVTIDGDVGQSAVGTNIVQVGQGYSSTQISPNDLEWLRRIVEDLKKQIESTDSSGKNALNKLSELEAELTSQKPNLDDIQIRRKILNTLYNIYQRDSLGAIDKNDLADKLNLSSTSLDRNILYLSDRQFVHLESSDTEDGRIYHFIRIAGHGVDLVEDPNEFNAKFPQAVIYQSIGGDYFQVKMGDHNSLIMGKNIISVPFGINDSLQETCKLFLDTLTKNAELDSTQIQSTLAELEKLQHQLKSKEIDLGEVQRIKQALLKEEGSSAEDTAALFSHPAVVEPIQRAVQSPLC